MVFGGGAFRKWFGNEDGAFMKRISALVRRDTSEKNVMWGHRQKMVVCKTARELSPDTESASMDLGLLSH